MPTRLRQTFGWTIGAGLASFRDTIERIYGRLEAIDDEVRHVGDPRRIDEAVVAAPLANAFAHAELHPSPQGPWPVEAASGIGLAAHFDASRTWDVMVHSFRGDGLGRVGIPAELCRSIGWPYENYART